MGKGIPRLFFRHGQKAIKKGTYGYIYGSIYINFFGFIGFKYEEQDESITLLEPGQNHYKEDDIILLNKSISQLLQGDILVKEDKKFCVVSREGDVVVVVPQGESEEKSLHFSIRHLLDNNFNIENSIEYDFNLIKHKRLLEDAKLNMDKVGFKEEYYFYEVDEESPGVKVRINNGSSLDIAFMEVGNMFALNPIGRKKCESYGEKYAYPIKQFFNYY